MSDKTFSNLRNAGYEGALQDMIKAKIDDLGFKTLYDQLGSEGYVGSLNDRLMGKARDNGYTTVSSYLALEGLFNILQRYFTRFDSGVNSYGEFTSDIVLDGDFVVRITHKTSNTGSSVLVGDTNTSDDFIWTDNNQLRIRINAGGFLSFGLAPPGITLSDNALHITEVRRVSGSISATTDGQAYPTALSNSDAFTVNAIAQRGGGLYWNGELANLYIEKAGVPVVNSPMDDAPTATFFRNEAAVLGSETWLQGPYTSNGVEGSFQVVATQGGYTADENLLTKVTTTGLTQGTFLLRVGDNTNNLDITEDGVIEIPYTVGGLTEVVLFTGGSQPNAGATVDISVREVPAATPLIIKRNIADTQTSLFDQVDDGWTGPELITQNVWENPSSVGSEWAFSDNQWSLTGTGALSALMLLSNSNQPNAIRLEGVASGVSGLLRTTANPVGADVSSNGSYLFDTNIATSGGQQFKRAFGVVSAVLDKPSIKEFLEVAS